MPSRNTDYRQFSITALIAFLVAAAIYFANPSMLESLDRNFYDRRFGFRKSLPSDQVVVIGIDNKAIEQYGRWAWPRTTMARLLATLTAMEPAAVALDMVFSEPTDAPEDDALAAVIENSAKIVTGYYFHKIPSTSPDSRSDLLQYSRYKLVRGPYDGNVIPSFVEARLNLAPIQGASPDSGFFNFFPDQGGTYRHIPLVLAHGAHYYPALAVAALQLALEEDGVLTLAAYGVESISLGGKTIPVNAAGRLPLNFYRSSAAFTTFSAADILNGTVDPSQIQGKICLLGVTDMGLGDIKEVPGEHSIPGVYLHATFLSNFLHGDFLHQTLRANAIAMAFTLLLPVLLVMLATRGNLFLWGGGILLTGAYLAANISLFTASNISMGFAGPMLGIIIGLFAGQLCRTLVVARRGRFLKKAFGMYLAPILVNRISNDPDSLTLKGEFRTVSCLFSDIRDFTTIAEQLEPQQLIRMLNSYLAPATDIILNNNGMLDKYIGDAIMALFNVPLDDPHHADGAVRSACEMILQLEQLNGSWKNQPWPDLAIGVGVHTGEAVVGNIGTSKRFDYTALGDAINLASRLEGLNKYYGTQILISEDTRDSLTEKFTIMTIDRVQVKGKKEPVEIFAVLPQAKDPLQPHTAAFEEARRRYLQNDFSGALEQFAELQNRQPAPLFDLYQQRCRTFLANPPPADWNGVTGFDKK